MTLSRKINTYFPLLCTPDCSWYSHTSPTSGDLRTQASVRALICNVCWVCSNSPYHPPKPLIRSSPQLKAGNYSLQNYRPKNYFYLFSMLFFFKALHPRWSFVVSILVSLTIHWEVISEWAHSAPFNLSSLSCLCQKMTHSCFFLKF